MSPMNFGFINPRYDPAIWLVAQLNENQEHKEGSNQDTSAPGMQRATDASVPLERDIDASMQAMEQEIAALKKDLEAADHQDHAIQARELSGFKYVDGNLATWFRSRVRGGACGFPLTTRPGEVSNFVHPHSKSSRKLRRMLPCN